jgi:hypothetical protein
LLLFCFSSSLPETLGRFQVTLNTVDHMFSKAQDLDFYLPINHFQNSKRDETELNFLESRFGKDMDKFLTINGRMLIMGQHFGQISSFNLTNLRNELAANPQSSIILVEETMPDNKDNFQR